MAVLGIGSTRFCIKDGDKCYKIATSQQGIDGNTFEYNNQNENTIRCLSISKNGVCMEVEELHNTTVEPIIDRTLADYFGFYDNETCYQFGTNDSGDKLLLDFAPHTKNKFELRKIPAKIVNKWIDNVLHLDLTLEQFYENEVVK